jgi:serine/threonine protein kinase
MMEGEELVELWPTDELDEDHVQDYYGTHQSVQRRWSDSYHRWSLHIDQVPDSLTSGVDAPCDFVRMITAISQTYRQGNYLRMRSLDRERWRQLGSGATFQVSLSDLVFGVVNARNHSETEQVHERVVIKRPKWHPGLALDEDSRRSFIRELRILHHLQPHPNIVKLRGVGWFYEHENMTPCPKPLLILEPADHTLDYLINDTKESKAWSDERVNLSSKSMLALFHDITCGLKYLHDNNIVHGDIKPANVLVFDRGSGRGNDDTPRWKAKLSDFSLSLLDAGADHRQKVRGTPGWMAPETTKMLSLDETKRTDIWSLGILFAVVFHSSYGILPEHSGPQNNHQAFCNQIIARFETKIESSSWDDDEKSLMRNLYLCTLRVDSADRDLLALHDAFSGLFRDSGSCEIKVQETLQSMSNSAITINYEALKPLSGSIKDTISADLKNISTEARDTRRPKALYELAVIHLSKFHSPDASETVGLTYLCQAAELGDVRAKGLYSRLLRTHRPQLVQIYDTNVENWLYEAASEGHQIALLELAETNGAKACKAKRAAAAKYFDASDLEHAEVSRDVFYDYISHHLRSYSIRVIDDWHISPFKDTPTHWAAATGRAEALEVLLDIFHSSPNVQNDHGDTALLLAFRHGQYSTVKILLDKHGDPNIRNISGENVLHHLPSFSSDKAMELLKRLKVHHVDGYAQVKGMLHHHDLEHLPLLPGLPVERAAAFNRYDLVEALLSSYPVYPTNGNIVRRLFLWATRLGNADIQRLCIAYSRSIHRRQKDLSPLETTKWTHNGQERGFMEAACLGWISAEGFGSDLPINIWMQACHGPQWESKLDDTINLLCEFASSAEEMEENVDQGLKVCFEEGNHKAFSILLDRKAEITNGLKSRAKTFRPLAWKATFETTGIFDNRLYGGNIEKECSKLLSL